MTTNSLAWNVWNVFFFNVEPRSPKSRCHRAALPPKSLGQILPCFFQLLVAPSVLGFWLLHTNLCSRGLFLCVSISPSPLSQIETLVMEHRPHPRNAGWSDLKVLNEWPLQRLLFQLRSHSWVLGLRIRTYLFVGPPTTQPTIITKAS